jgi:glycosyltransferase involved in cell wall biosynthesis
VTSTHVPALPTDRPPRDATPRWHVHVGTALHAPEPTPSDPRRPAFERSRRAAALTRGLAAHGQRQLLLGPRPGDRLPPPPTGARRVVLGERWPQPVTIGVTMWQLPEAVVHVHVLDLDDLRLSRVLPAVGDRTVVVHVGASAHAPLRSGTTPTVRTRMVGTVVERALLRRASLVVVPSAALGDVVSEAGADHVHVVPPAALPLPTGAVAPGLLGAMAQPLLPTTKAGPRPLRLVGLGALVPRRRPGALLEAAARLDGPTELVLLGTGPDRRRLEEHAARLADRVQLTVVPVVTHRLVAHHLAAADAVVFPTLAGDDAAELLTAMSLGRPTIATDVEGHRHHVTDGVDGVLVPPLDTDALVEAIGWLRDDPELAASLGASAARRVAAYGWDAVASRVLTALDGSDPAAPALSRPTMASRPA